MTAIEPTTLDFVTLAIAAVGAITGVAALGATWAQFWLGGPRLRVSMSTAIIGSGAFCLSVTVQNRGRTAATVTGLSLRIEDGKKQHIPVGLQLVHDRAYGPPFPHRVEPFAEASWIVEVDSIVRDLRADRRSTNVRAFTHFHGKDITSRETVNLTTIESMNRN